MNAIQSVRTSSDFTSTQALLRACTEVLTRRLFQGSCVIRPSAHFETAIHVASLIHHLMENKGAEGGAHLCMPERAHLANLQINKHINNSTEKLRVKCYIFPNLGVRADQALRIYFLQAVFKKEKKQTSNTIS